MTTDPVHRPTTPREDPVTLLNEDPRGPVAVRRAPLADEGVPEGVKNAVRATTRPATAPGILQERVDGRARNDRRGHVAPGEDRGEVRVRYTALMDGGAEAGRHGDSLGRVGARRAQDVDHRTPRQEHVRDRRGHNRGRETRD